MAHLRRTGLTKGLYNPGPILKIGIPGFPVFSILKATPFFLTQVKNSADPCQARISWTGALKTLDRPGEVSVKKANPKFVDTILAQGWYRCGTRPMGRIGC
jgi:hypothetical protein